MDGNRHCSVSLNFDYKTLKSLKWAQSAAAPSVGKNGLHLCVKAPESVLCLKGGSGLPLIQHCAAVLCRDKNMNRNWGDVDSSGFLQSCLWPHYIQTNQQTNRVSGFRGPWLLRPLVGLLSNPWRFGCEFMSCGRSCHRFWSFWSFFFGIFFSSVSQNGNISFHSEIPAGSFCDLASFNKHLEMVKIIMFTCSLLRETFQQLAQVEHTE